MSDDASASSSSSEYEPEYEPEEFHIVHKASGTDIALEVLSVVPPPIEYMSEIHTQKVEISGRQVWCGSLGLAYFFCQKKQEEPEMFRNKRCVYRLQCCVS